ncbi:hypothetical protein [Aquimonas sp.]|jgi:hypothetical protein|uniref:hypothetical protein n=1 Tax=Aquimonas sp. TaxID=1872588 RepID=UPI0037BEA58E
MSENSLSSIEWHDLPVSEIRVGEGGVSLTVTPYNEANDSYDMQVLRITDAETINIRISGSLSPKDLSSLEVSAFTYSIELSGRISGTIGLLPGQAGFWELSFTKARCELADG